MRNHKLTTMILSLTLLGGSVLAGGLEAKERSTVERGSKSRLSAKAGGSNAVGLSLFAGRPSGAQLDVITGYQTGTIYNGPGKGMNVTDKGVVLGRSGTYRVHLEGVLAFNPEDTTSHENAAAVFAVLIDGAPQVFCTTPTKAGAAPVAAALGFTENHDTVASCTVDYTIAVKGDGSDPLVFPQNSMVHAALIPNGRTLGDTTLMLVRLEITRIR